MNRDQRVWRTIGEFARGAFTRNLGLKSVAAVTAVALFLVVRLQEKEERWIEVDVNVRRPPPANAVVLTGEMPDTIRVLIRGRPSVVRSARKGERPQVNVDLSQKKEAGSFYHYFEEDAFGLGSGIEVQDVDPQSVLVRLERLVSRRLPVRVRTSGKVRSGAELSGQPVVTPGELSVSGPASLVRGLEEIETEEIDIEGLGTGEHVVNVPVRRREGIDVRHAADSVEVVFRVRWVPGQRTLAALPLRTDANDPGVVEIQPAEVTVVLSGPQVLLDKLEAPALVVRAVIPEDAPRPGTVRARVEVAGLDEQFQVKSIAPAKVQVRLSAAPRPRRSGPEPGAP
jgi:YbbR domain-containing protein